MKSSQVAVSHFRVKLALRTLCATEAQLAAVDEADPGVYRAIAALCADVSARCLDVAEQLEVAATEKT